MILVWIELPTFRDAEMLTAEMLYGEFFNRGKDEVSKTIQFNDNWRSPPRDTGMFAPPIQIFRKQNVNPKTRYRKWDFAFNKATRIDDVVYTGCRTLVKAMQEQEGWKLDASFYCKHAYHTRSYTIRRCWNFKKGRQRRSVLWLSSVEGFNKVRELRLGNFHATTL